jgi:hypothetical protein
MFTDRDDPPAAAADISVTRGRNTRFGCRKIIGGNPVLGIANDSAAQRALRADDLLALPCDQHDAA